MSSVSAHGNRVRRAGGRMSAMVVLLLVVAAVGIGVWQDRDTHLATAGEMGPIDQVVPEVAGDEALVTVPETGSLAPNFRLETITGEVIELADLRGKPVFLNFWATWCFFCLTEMPAIQTVADEYGDEIVVVGVNVGDSPEDARTFAGNFDIRYPLALNSDKSVADAYKVRQMPEDRLRLPHRDC